MMNKKRGFTMAEALSVIILLGVIATITIPTTVNRMTANQNRTKIKKALATYDSAVRLMISENRITSVERLNNLMSQNNCSRVYNYFKAVEQDGCIFKTADGVWWDVGTDNNGASMAKALIATDRDLLDIDEASKENLNPKNAFYLITDFDERKVPHIADMAFVNQKGLRTQIMNTSKLYAFVDNKKIYNYYNFCTTETLKSCVLKNTDGSVNFYNDKGVLVGIRRTCQNGINCKTNNLEAHNNCYKEGYTGNCEQYGGTCKIQEDVCDNYVAKYYLDSTIGGLVQDKDLRDKIMNSHPGGANFERVGVVYAGCEMGATSIEQCDTTKPATYTINYKAPKGTIEVYYYNVTDDIDTQIKNAKSFKMTLWKQNSVKGGSAIACDYYRCTDYDFATCASKPTNSECYE